MAPCEKSIADFCRLCAVEAKNGVVIYSSEGVNLCLEEKIIQCLRIEVRTDVLSIPLHIDFCCDTHYSLLICCN
jgi:hypothetical protein